MMDFLAETMIPLTESAAQMGNQVFTFLGPDGLSAGGAAAGLAGVWIFFKVIRRIVATLFMFCMAYLVCKCCFGVDISGLITPFLHLIGK